MKQYMNLGRDSGVAAYETGAGSITVQFKTGKTYLYTNNSAGAAHVTTMQKLADNGRGLNSFISRNVRSGYERSW